MAMYFKKLLEIRKLAKTEVTHEERFENEPLRNAEIYIEVDTKKDVPENKIKEDISKIGALRKLSPEKTLDSLHNSYVATFAIETIKDGKRIKEALKSIEDITYCGIRAFYTPLGNGSEG